MQSSRVYSIFCLVLSAVCIAGVCYFSYRSGCVFDGKTGTGDMAASKRFDLPWLVLLFLSFLFFMIGVSLAPVRRSWHIFIGGLIGYAVLILPLTLFFMFLTANKGTSDCNPTDVSPVVSTIYWTN